MEKVQLGGAKKFIKYSECEKGDVLIEQGRFLGSYEGNYGVCWEFESNDEITVLNSAGQLNYVLENHAKEGDILDVIYEGKTEVPKGPMKGKMAHQFKVEKYKTSPKQEIGSNDVSLDDLE